jgi:hypothetical protein
MIKEALQHGNQPIRGLGVPFGNKMKARKEQELGNKIRRTEYNTK